MPKFLIGTQDSKIRSVHKSPLQFSVSGRYVVDVPDYLTVSVPTDSLSALIAAKVEAFKTQLPGLPFPFSLSDELLSPSTVDAAFSRRVFLGRNKKTALFRHGYLTTSAMNITEVSRVYPHWNGFVLYSDPGPQPPDPVPDRPPPPRLLYNYDPGLPGFREFEPADFSVFLLDSISQTVVVSSVDGTHLEVASVAGLPDAPFRIIVDDPDPASFFQESTTVTEVGVFGPNVLTISDPLTRTPVAGSPVWWAVKALVPDTVNDVSYGPSQFRLRFVNVSSGIRHLSDWILMHDDAAGDDDGIFDFTFDYTFE